MNCNKIKVPGTSARHWCLALDKDYIILLVFLAALSIRLLYIFQVLKYPLTEYLVNSNTFDQYGFNQNALRIASGDWMGREIFGKEPLYSYFLAAIYTLFGYSHLAVYIIQAILTSIGSFLIYKISMETFNRAAGTISAFIFSFYSMSIYYDAIILRESLITFLNILLLYLILKALKTHKSLTWFTGGAVLGFLMLMRHNALILFILAFILFKKRPFKIRFKHAVIFCIGFFVILLPVLVRNYKISDYKYIGISKEVNAFWVGNNPSSSGVDVDWSSEYKYLNEKSGGSIIKTAAVFLGELKRRPKIYAKLYLRKIWMFFNAYEAPSNTNYYLYREEFRTILTQPLFNFRFVCAFGIIGIFLAFLKKEKPYLLFIFLAVLSASVILFHIQSRFRLSQAPFFIIFCGYSLYYLFDKIKYKYFLKSAVILTIAIFFYIILKPDLTYAGFRSPKDKIRPLDRTNLALSYVEAYKKEKNNNFLKLASRQCDLALKEEANYYLEYALKGRIYFLENRFLASVSEYKKAIIYDNRNPFVYNELGGVYYAMGAYQKSFLYIKRALRLYPGNRVFEKNLSLIPISL